MLQELFITHCTNILSWKYKEPKPTILKVAQMKGWPEVAPVPFLNPDPIACLVGCSNEAPVIVDGQGNNHTNWLRCSGIQCELPALQGTCTTNSVGGSVIGTRGDRGAANPYLGCVEVNLQIPGIANYNEDVLLLVIPTTTYSELVLVVVGSKIIDRALRLMTKEELAKVTTIWRQAHFGAVMCGLLQLTFTSSDKTKMGEGVGHSSPEGDPMKVRRFCLNDVTGPVCTTWKVTISLCSTVIVHANSIVKGHCMWVHVLMELMPGPQLPAAVAPTATYWELHPESSRVPICLHNLSTHIVEIPTKAVDGQVAPANQVPLVVHSTRTSEESNPELQKGWVLEALDLQGLKDWPESELKQARELLL